MRNLIARGVFTAAIAALVALATVVTLLNHSGLRDTAQGYGFLPTTGTYSGLQAANYINDALNAVGTCNKGTSAPTGLSGSAEAGMCWLDNTSATLMVKKRYTGAAWVIEGVLDVSNGVWVPPVGGGAAAVASASTADLCASPQALQSITGSTAISSFGSNCPIGTKKTLVFAGAVPLTYNATSLIIPGGADFTAAVGDVAEAVSLGSGNWRVTNITRVNGNAVTNPAVEVGTLHYHVGGDAPAKYVFGYGQAITRTSFPDYVTAVTRAQSGVRSSGNPTLTSVSDTSGMGAGMPIEGTGIPGGTTIVSVTSSTITMSANASSSGTSTATVFFTGYGSDGSSSTVGVPDCRGRVLAGRDDMGGSAASRLTSSYFGSSAAALGAVGGGESKTLITANLPSHNHAVFLHDPGHVHAQTVGPASGFAGGGNSGAASTGANNTASATTGMSVRDTAGGAGTANQTATAGSGTAFASVQPTIIANCIIRVLASIEPANDNDAPPDAVRLGLAPRRFA